MSTWISVLEHSIYNVGHYGQRVAPRSSNQPPRLSHVSVIVSILLEATYWVLKDRVYQIFDYCEDYNEVAWLEMGGASLEGIWSRRERHTALASMGWSCRNSLLC